jgi:hypothetical protein
MPNITQNIVFGFEGLHIHGMLLPGVPLNQLYTPNKIAIEGHDDFR